MSSKDDVRGRSHEHVHAYSGVTTCDKGHSHMFLGVTGPPLSHGLYDTRQHYHEVVGLTTFDFEHFHYYRGNTGPAIPVEGGYHTHQFRFRTSFEMGHDHGMQAFVEPTTS
jgi:hypothetical protein